MNQQFLIRRSQNKIAKEEGEVFSFIINSGENKTFYVPVIRSANHPIIPVAWNIEWGDGTKQSVTGNAISSSDYSGVPHIYPIANKEYEIKIRPIDPNQLGWLRAFSFGNNMRDSINRNKLLKITSGELSKQSLIVDSNTNDSCAYMFYSCENLISIGNFNLPQTIEEVGWYFARGMFSYCENITDWGNFCLPQSLKKLSNYSFNSTFFATNLLNPNKILGNIIWNNEFAKNGVFANMFSYCNIPYNCANIPLLESNTSVNIPMFKNANVPDFNLIPNNWK